MSGKVKMKPVPDLCASRSKPVFEDRMSVRGEEQRYPSRTARHRAAAEGGQDADDPAMPALPPGEG